MFSGTLNDNMEIAAVEGSYASVIGGAPAAAVVFAGEVNKRTAADPGVGLQASITETVENGAHADAAQLRTELTSVRAAVRSEKLRQVADEFDNRHSIERARSMGSVHTIVPATRLRPYLTDAVQRGMHRTLTTLAEHGWSEMK